MTTGLGQHALARVNQNDRQIAVGRTGRHVAGILLMPRRIGDNEFALVGRKEAIGHVNRDALLLLGLKPVKQQRKVHVVPGRAMLAADHFQRRELIFKDRFAIVKQPSDQGGLAIINTATGKETQNVAAFLTSKLAAFQR